MAMILSQLGNGSGFVYVVLPDGVTITANIENTSGAWQQVQKYVSAPLTNPLLEVDPTFSYRIFGNTVGVANNLAGATELTEFLVNRAAQAARYKTTATIVAGAVTIDRVSNDMFIVVDTEGGAGTDDLDSISITNFVENDVITFIGASAVRIVTIKNGTGNIFLSNGVDFDTSAGTTQISFRFLGTDWYEISRGAVLPTVTEQRASSVPTPIAGVNTTALGAGGGTINLEPGVDKGYQVYTGTIVLVGSWTIQIQAVPITPYLDGDTMIVDYRALATVGGNTVTIFGQTLTTAQALAGRYLAKATYKLSTTTWYYQFFENNGTGAAGVNMATVPYVDATFEPDLGLPAADNFVLSSTAAGVRSWLPVFSTGELYFDGALSATGANLVETTLKSYTLLANTLTAEGDSLYIEAGGAVAANANIKTIRLKIGGVEIIPHTGFITAPNGLQWNMKGTLIKTPSGAGVARMLFFCSFTNATTGAIVGINFENTTGILDFTTDLAIVVTGQNGVATANDIQSTSLFVSKIAKQS